MLNAFDTDATADGTVVDLTLLGSDVSEVGLAASSATGDVSFTNPKSILKASMSNGSGDLKITYGAVAVGTADSQDLALSNVSAATATIASVETVNVSSSLVKSTLTDLVIDGASTLNISGDANLTITNDVDFKNASSSTATDGTINASTFTGALNITPNQLDNVAITGGSGADTFIMGAGLNFYDSIAGGDGADTVTMSLAAATGAEAAYSYQLLNLSGIETLDVTSTADAASVSAASLSSDITTIALGSNVRTVTIVGTIDTAGEDLAFTLNGVTTAIATAAGTNDIDEIGAELAAAINALTGFSAVASAGAGTTDLVTITSVTGNAVEFTSLVNTTDATDDIATTIGAYTNAGVTGLGSDGSRVVEIHTANDINAGLADGSGTDDTVSLRLNTVTADKSVKQTINQITVANTETLNIEVTGRTDTVDTVVTTLTADAGLTTLNITGESDLDLTGTITASKLATIDASTATGDLATDVPALTGGSTVKGGSGKDNFIFGAGLNFLDVVTGGEGTDFLSADISGLSGLLTGYAKLNVADVETLNLTATTSTDLDAANITGATQISLTGAQAGTTSITNLAAGVAVGFGAYKTDGASTGRTDIALADATGTEDALSIVLNDTDGANTNAIELRASGFESAAISFGYNSSTDTALANHSIDVDRLNVPKITVSGSTYDVGDTLSLNTLDTDTTALDASGYSGILTATAGTATATEFTLKADRAHVITGSSKNDTFVLSGSHTNSDVGIDGNGGTDTLTMTLGAGAQDFDSITDIDTINLVVSGSAAITTNADTEALDGLNEASSVVVTGGNSLSSFAVGGGTDVLTGGAKTNVYNFSGYSGSVTAFFAADGFDDGELGYTQQFIGAGKATDAVTASYTTADGTVVINMQAVATFNLSVGNGSALNANFAKVTGLSEINFTDNSAELVTFSALDLGTTVDITSTGGTSVTVVPADATGSADTLSVKAKAGSANDVLKLVVADVETVAVKADSANQVNLDVSGVTMTATGATAGLTITGANDIEITADNADITSINAASNTGGVIQTVRAATGVFTATGGTGSDTFRMYNEGDVLAGGAGTNADTLVLVKNAILGGLNLNLNADDQVVSMNGSATSGTVTGFENVDVSGYTGTYGAQITALATVGSTITGTPQSDEIVLGTGADTVVIGLTTSDNISGFSTAADKIQLAAAVFGVGDYLEATGIAAGANADVTVATTALANDAAIVAAIQTSTDTTDTLFIVYNTADGEAQAWYDANPNVDGGEIQLATLVGVTDLSAFATGNFTFV
ncbi:hypothetical protein N8540_09650 [Gammaproteobacteria bacterium]|nr:hypothetical protein [Gammaproteobacteria bacterium]MDB9758596.1 hypothetical protein [Gammaproteobacteria bacterium]MDC1423844.1 hypothetical protein [Gammaproteobacteria bacterium]